MGVGLMVRTHTSNPNHVRTENASTGSFAAAPPSLSQYSASTPNQAWPSVPQARPDAQFKLAIGFDQYVKNQVLYYEM